MIGLKVSQTPFGGQSMNIEKMTIAEASRMADCSPSTIRRWLTTGVLDGTKTDGVWVIEEQVLRVHLNQLTKPFKGRQGASKEHNSGGPGQHEALHRQLQEDLHRERQINDELRAENKKLQEEIKALLAGKAGFLSRWIRSI